MAMFSALGRNLPYLRQQCSALLMNTSTSTKLICGVVVVSYFLSFSENAIGVLSVTPGYLMPPSFWLWTAFTFCFLEIHFWEVLVDIITVGLCGKLIEPLWGQMEQCMFFAIVNFFVALITTLFYFILYVCTSNPDVLFSVQIHGLAGYIAGVSVAVKQIMPDLVIVKTPLGKLSNRNIPLAVFVLTLIFWGVGLLEGTYPSMFLSGLLVSWVYLRFYQKHNNGSRGDMADYFTFASFFPNVIQPLIAIVSNTVYNIFVKIGLCKKVVRRFDLANPSGVNVSLPNADQHDIERRRHIALKALSERLYKKSLDVQPLLPKTNPKVLLPPNITHGSASSSTSQPPQVVVVAATTPTTPSVTSSSS